MGDPYDMPEYLEEEEEVQRLGTTSVYLRKPQPVKVPAPIAPELRQKLAQVALEVELHQAGFWDVETEWYEGTPSRARRIAKVPAEVVSAVYDLGSIDEFERAAMEAIVEMVMRGVTEHVAARAVGMSSDMFRRTKKISAYFRLSLRMALALSESKLVDVVAAAAMNGDTRSAQWMLERRFPQRWSKQETKKVQGKVEHRHVHRGIAQMPRATLLSHAKALIDAEVIDVDPLPLPSKTTPEE